MREKMEVTREQGLKLLTTLRSVRDEGVRFKNSHLERTHDANGVIYSFNQEPVLDPWSELGCRIREAIEFLEQVTK